MDEEERPIRVAWSPQPRQARFIACPAKEIFFGGSRGGGKTDGVIGHFFARAEKWKTHAKGLVLRRTLKGLLDFERRCKEVYGSVFSVKDHWHEQKKLWEFPNGATLWMNYCETDNDVLQYQGHGYSFIYPEELTQWKLEETYQWLFTINREPTVGEACQIVATGNPGGEGMEWVKRRFIDSGPPDRIQEHKIWNPRTETEEIITRVFIPSSLKDNIYLQNTGYERGLLSLPERMKLMYYDGRWDVVDGAFFDEWDPAVHVCRAFNPPPEWKRWFSFDWGYAAPYAGLWWCQSPAGKIYIYREIYGLSEDGKANKGTREHARLVAQKIKQIEASCNEHVTERWVDGSIYDNDGGDASIGKLFESEGIFFERARKTDKVGGVQMFRQMIAVTNKISQLQFMDNCRNLIRTFPLIQVDPRNPDIYLSSGEDHLADCLYMGARKNLPSPGESRIFKGNQGARRSWGSGGWR